MTWLDLGNLGNLLTGLAASAAMIFGLSAWKKQERERKRAEVAGKSLSIVLRLVQAIRYITSPTVDSQTLTQAQLDQMIVTERFNFVFNERLKSAEKDFDAFFLVKNEAAVYLNDEINNLLDNLWKRWIEIRVDFKMYLMGLESGETRSEFHLKAYENVYGSSGNRKTAELEDKLKEKLRPYARLEISESSQALAESVHR